MSVINDSGKVMSELEVDILVQLLKANVCACDECIAVNRQAIIDECVNR